MRTRVLAWSTAILTAYVVAVTTAEPLSLVSDAPGANLVIQTTTALVAVLVAVVAFGRFRQRRRAADLFLVLSLGQLATSSLLFTVFPLASNDPAGSRTVWAGVLTRFTAAVLLIAAARVRPVYVEPARRAHGDEGALLAGTALLALLAFVAAAALPQVSLGSPAERLWDAGSGLAAVSALTALAALLAATGFVRGRDDEPDDELLGWLAIAAILSAGSNAATAGTFMSTYSPYVSAADVLKLASSLVLLGGVVREIRGYWRDRGIALIAEERRRIARDLHDGMAQELAYLVTASRTLARQGRDDLWDICSAAERALDESRRAIAALTSDASEPLDVALAQTAEEVAGRLGTNVTLELAHVAVTDDVKEALLRIAREAIANAARHGSATRVHVRLSGGDAIRLRVSDNGRGFDTDATPAAGRLGITGMRERAAALGAVLTISSRRPNGTDVEVVLP